MTLGYAVQVKEVAPDAEGTPTPSVADDELEATTAWYRSKTGPFRLRYPKEWKAQQAAPGVTAVFASEEGGALEIVERDMVSLGMGKLTQDEYVDQVIRRLETTAPGFKLISVKPFQTEGSQRQMCWSTATWAARVNVRACSTCTSSGRRLREPIAQRRRATASWSR